MAWIKITHKIQSPANSMLYDLFHGGSLVVSGHEIRIENPALPVAVREADHILWTFTQDVRVQTPGPDSRLISLKQYRDRIEFSVFPWAFVTIVFE